MDFLEPHSYFCICLYLFKKAEALRHLLDLHNIPVTNEREMIAQLVKNLLAMQETWVLIPGLEDPLEKEMAAHSSTLAWEIPWTEESRELQSMGWRNKNS